MTRRTIPAATPMAPSKTCSDPKRAEPAGRDDQPDQPDPADEPRLRRLFERPELARLLDATRRRVEQGGAQQVSIADPSESERRAVDELLGRRPSRGKRLSVSLTQLEAVLRRAGLAPDLDSALVALGGPLRDRRAERAREPRAWHQLLQRHAPTARRLGLSRWLEDLHGGGLLKRVSGRDPRRAEALLTQTLGLLERLPARGTTLSTLAATALGDAHALDPGRPVASLARRALMAWTQREEARDDELWAGVGVLVGGGITSTALVLNLSADGDGMLAAAVNAAATVGEPLHLTLRQLLREPVAWRVAPQVPPQVNAEPISVCENPAVVAEAANRLGARCRPLICTLGQPSVATTTLLDQLLRAGATLRYHGDFDWPGLRIANGLMTRHGLRPWRMTRADYLGAADSGKPLAGDPVVASWDPGLTPAMAGRGQAIDEERLIADLLADLAP